MALDAIFLKHLVKEISPQIIGKKVDKIFQPTKHELAMVLRDFSDKAKLLISTSASCARVHLTNELPQNSKTPPMFCMLMRKHLRSAILDSVELSDDTERLFFLKFSKYNDLGDIVRFTLVVELMGKYSNIILLDQASNIIDSIQRVDSKISSKRLVLPKFRYLLPPDQGKLSLENHDPAEILARMQELCQGKTVAKALLATIKGISASISEEIAFRAGLRDRIINENFSDEEIRNCYQHLYKLQQIEKNTSGKPFIIKGENDNFIDFSFMELKHLGNGIKCAEMSGFSNTVEYFYAARAVQDRISSKTHNLKSLIHSKRERIKRKLQLQKIELNNSLDREKFKICADILQSNLNSIKKGDKCIKLQNFYDNMKNITIELDPRYTAVQNAQNYYKKYKKAINAERYLKLEIDKGSKEVEYLDGILDFLNRLETEEEFELIKKELYKEGYIKRSENAKKKIKQEKKLPPIKHKSSSGFIILTGRNNQQNDNLSLHKAKPDDIWFHVKNIPGSHTILIADGNINGGIVTDKDILDAANIAVFYSSARGLTKIDVDYTKIKHVKKPNGAKPGKVIYFEYKTIKAGGPSY